MIQLGKSTDLQDIRSAEFSQTRKGHTLEGHPFIVRGDTATWRRFGKLSTMALDCEDDQEIIRQLEEAYLCTCPLAK